MKAALVIDTCGAEGYVAVFPTGSPEAAALSERRLGVRATQEELLPAVQSVLSEARLRLSELAAVAVVRGPGSFTGVRIGLSTAKGLCEAAALPLVTLSRLRVLAGAVEDRPAWAWLQAGRGEVYAERFGGHEGPDGHMAEPEEQEQRFATVLPLDRARTLAEGDAIAVCEEALATAATGALFVVPPALDAALRRAAAEAIRQERWADVALTDALYLRVPDAELALRAKQA
jgi:tRNA threonylcarbamoyladenosine biosynthesis protein TsaB